MITEILSIHDFDKYRYSPVLIIDFTAFRCEPCAIILPKFEEYAGCYATDCVIFAKCNVDHVPELTADFQIMSMPTFVVLKNGERVDTLVGANESGLHELVMRHAIFVEGSFLDL